VILGHALHNLFTLVNKQAPFNIIADHTDNDLAQTLGIAYGASVVQISLQHD